MSDNHTMSHESAIFNIWLNWIVAGGALTLPILLGAYLPKLAVPFITFAVMGALIIYDRSSLRSRSAVCPLIPSIVIRSLGISGVIMLIIAVLFAKGVAGRVYGDEVLNPSLPFNSVLIIAPVVFLVTVWTKILGLRYSACQTCRVMLGTRSERGFLGKLFAQESEYQRFFIMGISAILTVVCWVYYFFFYINVNLNTPDRFFFCWIPVILYLLSVFYLGARYFTIWAYYFQDTEGSEKRHGRSTSIRFLILWDDNIFLRRNEDEYGDIPDSRFFDTPAEVIVTHRDTVTKEMATMHLCNILNVNPDDFSLRFMYESFEASGNRNVFHFICTPHDKDIKPTPTVKNGKWYNLSRLERLLHNHELSPMLAAEIHRLYTVTMAWKTYNADGRRLYKVKNYRPIFRIKGIQDWDVDFNSPRWLNVARFNEDKPFYRLRRLFNRSNDSEN